MSMDSNIRKAVQSDKPAITPRTQAFSANQTCVDCGTVRQSRAMGTRRSPLGGFVYFCRRGCPK